MNGFSFGMTHGTTLGIILWGEEGQIIVVDTILKDH